MSKASIEMFGDGEIIKLRDARFWWFHDEDGRKGLTVNYDSGDNHSGIQIMLTDEELRKAGYVRSDDA